MISKDWIKFIALTGTGAGIMGDKVRISAGKGLKEWEGRGARWMVDTTRSVAHVYERVKGEDMMFEEIHGACRHGLVTCLHGEQC